MNNTIEMSISTPSSSIINSPNSVAHHFETSTIDSLLDIDEEISDTESELSESELEINESQRIILNNFGMISVVNLQIKSFTNMLLMTKIMTFDINPTTNYAEINLYYTDISNNNPEMKMCIFGINFRYYFGCLLNNGLYLLLSSNNKIYKILIKIQKNNLYEIKYKNSLYYFNNFPIMLFL